MKNIGYLILATHRLSVIHMGQKYTHHNRYLLSSCNFAIANMHAIRRCARFFVLRCIVVLFAVAGVCIVVGSCCAAYLPRICLIPITAAAMQKHADLNIREI